MVDNEQLAKEKKATQRAQRPEHRGHREVSAVGARFSASPPVLGKTQRLSS